MSRFIESDDQNFSNEWAFVETWQRNALRGKKGKEFLRELRDTLLAMPEHRLIDGFIRQGEQPGSCEVCALGAVAVKRRVEAGEDFYNVVDDLAVEMDEVDAYWTAEYGQRVLGINRHLAYAIAAANDEDAQWYGPACRGGREITPEERWTYMYEWVCKQLGEEPAEAVRA